MPQVPASVLHTSNEILGASRAILDLFDRQAQGAEFIRHAHDSKLKLRRFLSQQPRGGAAHVAKPLDQHPDRRTGKQAFIRFLSQEKAL